MISALLALIYYVVKSAITWHRFVLAGETYDLSGYLRCPQFWNYIGASFLVVLISIPIAIPFLIVDEMFGGSGAFIQILSAIPATWALYRLSPFVVSVAVNYRITLGEAWRSTRSISLGLFLIAILICPINFAMAQILTNLTILSVEHAREPFRFLVDVNLGHFIYMFSMFLDLAIISMIYKFTQSREAV